ERVWVMDRGMIDEESLKFLGEPGRRYLLSTKRHALKEFHSDFASPGWQHLPDNPEVEVKLLSATKSIIFSHAANHAEPRNAPCVAANGGACQKRLRKFTCVAATAGSRKATRFSEPSALSKRGSPRRIPSSRSTSAPHTENLPMRGTSPNLRTPCVATAPTCCAATRPDGPHRNFGNLHSTHRRRTRLSRFENESAVAADLAPLLRPHQGPRFHLRVGLCPVEDARPSGETRRLDDVDPQARSAPRQRCSQAAADDAGGDPAGAVSHSNGLHGPADDGRP